MRSELNEMELYWLAGLLEGEGSFSSGPPSAPNSVPISLTMTDEDVVARVATLWNVAYHPVHRKRSVSMGWKQSYFVHIRGKPAVDLMRQLKPLMSNRRREQIERALSSYDPHLRRKLRPEQITEIRARLNDGCKHSDLARRYGVDRSTISHIKAGA
jgi:hypothetical protein